MTLLPQLNKSLILLSSARSSTSPGSLDASSSRVSAPSAVASAESAESGQDVKRANLKRDTTLSWAGRAHGKKELKLTRGDEQAPAPTYSSAGCRGRESMSIDLYENYVTSYQHCLREIAYSTLLNIEL